MAIKAASGFFTEETPESITQSSVDQGLGTPESPKGAAAAGATPQQAAMVGTPAQTQNAQKVESQTLEQTKRYEKKPEGTQAQQGAREAADTLSSLGPVRANVQSLIQSRIQNITGTDDLPGLAASLQLNQAAIEQLPSGQREAVTTAMQAYLDSPSEVTANAVYNLLGPEALENQGIANYLSGVQETIQQVTQGALAGEVTLGTLQAEGGLTTDLQEIADALGVPVEQVGSMTLQQLDAAIDSVEASELNQVEQIRARLSDPALPQQVRQELLRQLGQLSAAGLVGAEAGIDRLDAQIQAADSVDIGGVQMSLQDALSDAGISATIARAVQDPEYLEDIKGLPGYENLGAWVEQNKESLETLVGELEETTEDFVDLQYKFSDIKNSLGADGSELLSSLFPSVDFSGTIMSGDMADLESKLSNNTAYQFLSDPNNAGFLASAKNNPDVLEDVRTLADSGFQADQMDDILESIAEIRSDKTMKALFGEDIPSSPAAWEKMQEDMAIYEDLDPPVQALGDLVQAGELDLQDLQDISSSESREEILQDISQSRIEKRNWNKIVEQASDKHKGLLEYLFSQTGFSVRDLNATIRGSDKETRQRLLAIFDANRDGQVTDAEFKDPKAADRANKVLGVGLSPAEVANADGAWDAQKIRESIQVTPGGWFNSQAVAATKWVDKKLESSATKAQEAEKEAEERLGKLGLSLGMFKQAKSAKNKYDQANKYKKANLDLVETAKWQDLEAFDVPRRSTAFTGNRSWIRDGWEIIDGRVYEPEARHRERVRRKVLADHDRLLANINDQYAFDTTHIGRWDLDKIDELTGTAKKHAKAASKFRKLGKTVSSLGPEDEEKLAQFIGKYM